MEETKKEHRMENGSNLHFLFLSLRVTQETYSLKCRMEKEKKKQRRRTESESVKRKMISDAVSMVRHASSV